MGCFKLLSFEVICYIEISNMREDTNVREVTYSPEFELEVSLSVYALGLATKKA